MSAFEEFSVLIAFASLLISCGNLAWLVIDARRRRETEKPRITTKLRRTTARTVDGMMTLEWWGYICNFDKDPVTIADCGFQIWNSGKLLDDPRRSLELPTLLAANANLSFSPGAQDIAFTLRRAGFGGTVWIRSFCTDAYQNTCVSDYQDFNIDEYSFP